MEKVRKVRKVGQQKFYLVKWAGWPSEYNSYEPKEHIEHAPGTIRAFERKRKNSDKVDGINKRKRRR